MQPYFNQIDVLPGSAAPVVKNIATPAGGGGTLFDGVWGWDVESESGLPVNHTRALGLAPTLQGVTMISGDLGTMPMVLERHEGDNSTPNKSLPGGKLMRNLPNPLMTPCVFKQTLMNHALMEGNGLAAIQRDGAGRPVVPDGRETVNRDVGTVKNGMVPLIPAATWIEYDPDGYLWYKTRIRTEEGTKTYKLAPRDTFHIKGLAHDGLWGYRLVDIARDVYGEGLGLQRHTNRFFRNAARPSGVLSFPGRLDPESRRNLRREWNDIHQGLDNTAQLAVLQQGGTYVPMSMSNVDAQVVEMLESDTKLQASLLNMNAAMLNAGDFERIKPEDLNLWYLQHSLWPWLCKWCEEARYKLLSTSDYMAEELYFRFDLSTFLATNVSQLFEAVLKGVGGPALMRSDGRKMLRMVMPNLEIDEDDKVYLSRSTGEEAGMGTEGAAGEEAARAETQNRVARLMARECQRLARTESNRIKQAAGNGRGLDEFLESFYGSEWLEQCESVVSPEAAREYCNIRRDELTQAFESGGVAAYIESDCQEYQEHGRHLLNIEMGGHYAGNGKALT